ncbi:MAG: helix-turn-helix transcriptional regulator [Clostridia bacterium]
MTNVDQILAVSSLEEYIHSHLKQPLTLKQLADYVNYSPWHTAKIFKNIMGKTPFEYIRMLRLTQAALKLRDNNPKILDVALDHFFSSHEGFTRAFAKEFGLTPKEYREKTPPINLFIPTKIYHRYLDILKGENKMKNCESNYEVKGVFVQIIERPERKMILKRGINATHYFEYCEEVDSEKVWGVLESIKEALYEPVGMWLPKQYRPEGTSVYAQGVEVPSNYSKAIPEGFDIIELPETKLMIFQGEPYDDDDFQSKVGAVMELIKNYNPENYGYKWAPENGPRVQLKPFGFRGYRSKTCKRN